MVAWDFNVRNLDDGNTRPEARLFHTRYDTLHRPVAQWLKINSDPTAMIETFTYSDTANFTSAVGVVDRVALDAAQQRNLVGQATQHYDPSGLATVARVDFKGAAEEITRTLVKTVEAPIVDWNRADRATLLEPETFTQITEHDALGRMTRHYNWHIESPTDSGTSARVAVYLPHYNRRGALERETLLIHARKIPGDHEEVAGVTRSQPAIKGITYNAKGQKLSLELGNGTTTRYSYDADTFRLMRLYTRRDVSFSADCGGEPPPPRTAAPDTDTPPRSCGVQNLHYTYDPVGNITHIQDDAQQTIWFANQQVEPSSDYAYDALYRLIEASGRENAAAVGAPPHPEGKWPSGLFPAPALAPATVRTYTQRYVYDSVGNIISMEHRAPNFPGQPSGSWTRHYDYAFNDPAQPASNQLWKTWEGADAWNSNNAINKTIYRYDPHGSMLNLANTAPAQDMRWDWRDMIRALDLEGGGDAFYNYGSDKQRTRKFLKRNGEGSEDRIYLGGYELYRRRNSLGAVVEEIESLHLFEAEQRVLLVDDVIKTDRTHADGRPFSTDPIMRYQYGNHLGSVGVELDESAQVISYEEFHPYGTSAYRLLNSATEAPAKRYRYTGMERDEESGLGYHGARYYAPWLERWTSCDPNLISDGPNVYVFVVNNPINFADPNGRNAVPKEYLALQNPLPLLPMRQPSPAHQGPVLTQGVAWNPTWDSATYQRANAEEMYYATRPLEALARSAKEQRDNDVVAFIANFGIDKNMPGYTGPTTTTVRVRGAPTHEVPIRPGSTNTILARKAPATESLTGQVTKPIAVHDPETALRAQQQNKVANIDYNNREGASFEKHVMDQVGPKLQKRYGDLYREQEMLPGYKKAGGGSGDNQGKNAIPEAFVVRPDGTFAVIIDAKSGSVDNLAQLHTYLDYLQWQGPGQKGYLVIAYPEGLKPELPKSITDRLEQGVVPGTKTKLNSVIEIKFREFPGWTASYPRK